MDLQPNKTDGIYLPITNTRISASEWNQLVGSCMAFITEAGLTPDASDNEQFLNAFKTIAAGLEIVGANTNLSNLTATGKSTAAGLAMPSNTYDTLTPGASGTTYTAPANGYMVVRASSINSFAYIHLSANNTIFSMIFYANGIAGQGSTLPVVKGSSFEIQYSGVTIDTLRFIYAEGSKSEAN